MRCGHVPPGKIKIPAENLFQEDVTKALPYLKPVGG
jgi:hypothetical protein